MGGTSSTFTGNATLFGKVYFPRLVIPVSTVLTNLIGVAIQAATFACFWVYFKFFTQAWEDWTLLTFAMFGCIPLLVAIGFDEVDRLYSLPFMVILTLMMAGTALAYLRSTRPWQRVVALLVGIILTVAVVAVAPTAYWLEHGWVNVKWTLMIGAIVVTVMFSPLLLGLLRRSVQFLQAGKS